MGNYPLYLSPKDKKSWDRARLVGSGFSCNLGVKELAKLGKSKEGKRMFMIGESRGRQKKARPPTEIITQNPIESKPTYKIPEEINEKKDGDGLRMFETGMTMFGTGIDSKLKYGPSYVSHVYPQTFI